MSTNSRVIGPESALVRALTRVMVKIGRHNFSPVFDWACDLEKVPKSHKKDVFVLAAQILMDQLKAESEIEAIEATPSETYSFPKETKVLLSDGTEKEISKVCVGDKVVTVAPEEPVEPQVAKVVATIPKDESEFDFDEVDHLSLTRLDAKAIPATMPRGSGSATVVEPPAMVVTPPVVIEPLPVPKACTKDEEAEALLKSMEFSDTPKPVNYDEVFAKLDSDPVVVDLAVLGTVEQGEVPIGPQPVVKAAAETPPQAAKEAPEQQEEDPFGIGREIEALVRTRLAIYKWAIKPFWFSAEIDNEPVHITGLWTIKGISEPSFKWTLFGKAANGPLIHNLAQAFEPDFKAIEWPLRMRVTYAKSAFYNTIQDVRVTCRVWAIRYVPGTTMRFWIHESKTAHKGAEDIWTSAFPVQPPKVFLPPTGKDE